MIIIRIPRPWRSAHVFYSKAYIYTWPPSLTCPRSGKQFRQPTAGPAEQSSSPHAAKMPRPLPRPLVSSRVWTARPETISEPATSLSLTRRESWATATEPRPRMRGTMTLSPCYRQQPHLSE
ncbi:hypothetical protein ACJQWK_07914 [Exserohilum turcicum]